MGEPIRLKLALAFAAIYFIWGSTFLAIRYAIAEIPPFTMAGVRFVSAGAILYLWRRLAHNERPAWNQWPAALAVGALLFLGGNGAVVWSEQHVTSGMTALMLGVIPLWVALLDAMRREGAPLTPRVLCGLALGVAGIILLLGPSALLGGGQVDPVGAGVLMVGGFCWACGSIVSRQLRQPRSPALAAGMQMLMGGVVLLAVGFISGESGRIDPAGFTPRGALALAYLILMGSVVSFTAYTWLMSVTTPARVATYAYVNPLVAVLLGWVLAGEPLTYRTFLATIVIVAAVVIIIRRKGSRADV